MCVKSCENLEVPERTVGKDVEREGGVHAEKGVEEMVWWEANTIVDIDGREEVGIGLVWVFFKQLQPRR